MNDVVARRRRPERANLLLSGAKVRVAFIINDLSGGGAEKALKLLASFLVEDGVEIAVITLQGGNDSYSLDERIERVELRSGRIARGIGKILALPVCATELVGVMHRWQPDLCVSFLPRSNIAHVMTRWFGNRRPILLTEQISSRDNYPGRGIGDRVMRALISYFYSRATAVFPSSEGVMEGLRTFGVPRERMHVVYNAISMREIRARTREEPLNAEADHVPTIITVGRHAEQKDHETLLRAFALVRARTQARLTLVGQGPNRKRLEALAHSLGVADAVEFAGWQANPFAWMARADVFVLSSRFEGFGNVLVEAMACDLPVISTDCPSGPSEILERGACGFLVPVGDADAMADAIVRLLSDRAERDHFVSKARLRAPDFDIAVIGPRYAALLRSQLNHRERNA